MSDYLLDTNILIHYYRKEKGYRDLVRDLERDGELCISAVTRIEIVRGMREHERESTFQLLNSMETLNVTSEIADSTGEIVRTWKAKGFTLGDADAIIAATALFHELTLVTTNPKHFPMPELVIFQADEQGNLSPYKAG